MRKVLVKLAQCCACCCLCACCPRNDDNDSEEEDGGRAAKTVSTGPGPAQGVCLGDTCHHSAEAAASRQGSAWGPVADAPRQQSQRARSTPRVASVCGSPQSVAMATLLSPTGSPSGTKKHRDKDDASAPNGSLSGSSRPSMPLHGGEESAAPSNAPLAEELQAAVASAMQNSAIGACFRANHPNRVSALRKRGQQAWRRAMRAGGPFAPGSVVGAVAAANHRRSVGNPHHAASAPAATGLSHHATAASTLSSRPTQASAVAVPTPQGSLATCHSDGFVSIPSLAANSVPLTATSVPLTATSAPPLAASTLRGVHDVHAHTCEPLGRPSIDSQVSNASSSYFSVLSADARNLFSSGGGRSHGGGTSPGASGHASGTPAPQHTPRPAASPAAHHHQHSTRAHHHGIPVGGGAAAHQHQAHARSRPHHPPPPWGSPSPSGAAAAAAAAASAEGAGLSEDMDGPLPFQNSSHPAVEAFRAGQLGLGFSGGGFLFPWHLGVVTELKDMGVLTDTTHLAGASCGAIIVSCVNSGLDLHGLVDKLLEFADDCRTHGTAGRLRYVIEHFMTKELPPDAHVRCSGRTHIQLTRVFPYLKVTSISEYHSKEDLVQAIATSSHIPAYNDGSLVARFRNGLYIDGGVLRHLPVPPRVAFSAGVSCVPLKFLNKLPGANRLSILRHLAISPDLFQDFPYDWQQLAGLVLVPASDPILLSMIEHGKRDARTWASVTGLASYLSGTMFVPMEPSPFAYPEYAGGYATSPKHGQRGPGRRQQWHATAAETMSRLGLGLSGTGALGSMSNLAAVGVGSISEYLWAAAASVTSAAGVGVGGSSAVPVGGISGTTAAADMAHGGPGAGMGRGSHAEALGLQEEVEVHVTGGVLDGPALWSPADNAYVARVVVPGGGCAKDACQGPSEPSTGNSMESNEGAAMEQAEQVAAAVMGGPERLASAVLGGSEVPNVVAGGEGEHSQAKEELLEAAEAAAQMQRQVPGRPRTEVGPVPTPVVGGGPRLVTVRVKGQGVGGVDTLVTFELS